MKSRRRRVCLEVDVDVGDEQSTSIIDSGLETGKAKACKQAKCGGTPMEYENVRQGAGRAELNARSAMERRAVLEEDGGTPSFWEESESLG